ncbi:hemin ABC transporter substrate-binding protein [uncultured Corynebacterium sp.]|uniref:heme/hemin ABC transporter substrate-binding protein n=1 Tax=uncultured Corynebacterium sp. TaxID=159447 RepID=UPI0025D26A18|nr:ABC transporter substrate-binding protein [uncultured Corynebacterium sp.]
MSVILSGRRRRPLATVLSVGLTLSLTVGLAACGVGSENGGGVGDAHETSFDAAVEAFPDADAVPAATDTRGVSYAPLVGDVTPVTADPRPALPVSLTDADGVDVTVDDVSRIIPLDISGTLSRTLAGLGLRDNIVGRTVSSMEPSLADLPVVTHGGHSISAEAVLNLRPSLIILNASVGPEDAVRQIREAGVPVVMMEDPEYTPEAVAESITTVADIVGLPDEGRKLAERAGDEAEQARDTIRDLADATTDGTPLRAAFLYARGDGGVFYILGPDSGTSELIEGLGAVDVAKENGITDMAPATAEALAKLDPDVLVMMSAGLQSTGNVDGLLTRPGIAQTTAGRDRRILAIPDSQALSFGPQTGEMLLAAAGALYDPDSHRDATAS